MTGAKNGAGFEAPGAGFEAPTAAFEVPDAAFEAPGAGFEASGAGFEAFEVWRQDDNGNRFLMSRHPDRASADAAVAAMEAGVQHKQLYWVVERSQT